jgi:hypothetical protein
LSRTAFIASIAVHGLAGYWLSGHVLSGASLPSPARAEFFLFERPVPRASEAAPAAAPAEAVPEVQEERPPAPRPVQPAPQPTIVVEPPRAVEPAPQADVAPTPAPRAYIDLDNERRRAANQVIGARAAENEYLTFSLDDVVEPLPEPEPERPSIFDGGGADFGGRSVGTVGEQRTRLGRKLAELCNALTGGFGVGFQGFGLFSACASPDWGPSGLFPEVRPAYLDLMPECTDTRDTAPALALEAPFPTVKCRLVKREEIPDELP